jgi:hypothetical protein
MLHAKRLLVAGLADACGLIDPCKHISYSGKLAVLRRKATRRSRTRLRADLAHGREPSTTQHRHSAHWDAW